MKYIAFILCIFVSVYGQSQENIASTLSIEITCGFASQTSQDIQAFKSLINLNDTTAIRNKLFEGSKLEQILTAIILRYYKVNGLLRLTEDQQKKIIEVSKLKDRFSLCFTCTFHQEGTVKKLFNDKKYFNSYSIIERFLLERL